MKSQSPKQWKSHFYIEYTYIYQVKWISPCPKQISYTYATSPQPQLFVFLKRTKSNDPSYMNGDRPTGWRHSKVTTEQNVSFTILLGDWNYLLNLLQLNLHASMFCYNDRTRKKMVRNEYWRDLVSIIWKLLSNSAIYFTGGGWHAHPHFVSNDLNTCSVVFKLRS